MNRNTNESANGDPPLDEAAATCNKEAAEAGSNKMSWPPITKKLYDEREVLRLRNKNRTNSKRFRDRKKSSMDSLFEEKYRLGKLNDDLRIDSSNLLLQLEEAVVENDMHRQNAAFGLYNRPRVDRIIPSANPHVWSSLLAAHLLSTSSLGLGRLPVQASPRILEDFLVSTANRRTIRAESIDEVKTIEKERMLEKLAFRNSLVESYIQDKTTNGRSAPADAAVRSSSSSSSYHQHGHHPLL
jgi:hypothetical protein